VHRAAVSLNPPSASSLPIYDSGQEVPDPAELEGLKGAPDKFV
jgi:hypothetical protein